MNALFTTALLSQLLFGTKVNIDQSYNVAFIGNSIQYFNDLPRFLEVISNYHIHQNSCLRPTATLTSLWKKGSGMKTIFNTSRALLSDGTTYDIGAPDVYSLLMGDDSFYFNIKNKRQNDDDGDANKPEDQFYCQNYHQWDFVVLNDRTYYPAIEETRNKSIKMLGRVYLPIFEEINVIPVIIATHAYRVPSEQTKSLGDVPTYTNLVYEGLTEYANAMEHLSPRIAKVGKGFQLIYEENYDFWYSKLFNTDNYHPSPHGTFLQGCIIYCTIFGRLPLRSIVLDSNGGDDNYLFHYGRVYQPVGWSSGGDYLPKPTYSERVYLYNIAKRICREDGYV